MVEMFCTIDQELTQHRLVVEGGEIVAHCQTPNCPGFEKHPKTTVRQEIEDWITKHNQDNKPTISAASEAAQDAAIQEMLNSI